VQLKIEYNVILLVLYGCETWSFILRKGHRMRMFANKLLKRIFLSKKVEVRKD
jgi:hypothetical protein